ncbi:MAG TPA: hypothetical protein VIM03_13035, partial [Thermoleophilaceae bacterium]
MGVRSLTMVVLALLLAPTANAARAAHAKDAAWNREAHGARTALTRSVKAGYLSPQDEGRYLGILAHARAVRDRVPPLRARLLDEV